MKEGRKDNRVFCRKKRQYKQGQNLRICHGKDSLEIVLMGAEDSCWETNGRKLEKDRLQNGIDL